ncbi:hypothetical protein Tco_0155579 [Tanacetum coccineum]
MAEPSLQNPSSPNITPKEEPDTQERPESPNLFLPTDQCLEGKSGGHDQISNKDAIILYCLANGVEIDFARLDREVLSEKGTPDREVPVNETFHEETDDELTKKELKQVEVDDQAIQTILLGLSEDIYAAVNRCETAQEIWLGVQQMIKGSNIGGQEKKAKLFNEWERLDREVLSEKGTPDREVPVNETFHEETDEELTKKELKQVEVDDQAIQTILLGLSEDIYAAVNRCETAQEIWLGVQQMIKGSNIGAQEKKAKLFNEWERFTSTNGGIDRILLSSFLKANEGLQTKQTLPRKDSQQSQVPQQSSTRMETTYHHWQIARNHSGYNAGQNVRNSVVQNSVQNPGNQNVGNQIGLIVFPGIANLNVNQHGNVVATRAEGNVKLRRRDVVYLQTQLLIAQKEEAGIQLQAKEFDLMAPVGDLDEIKEVNANCILMANFQQASTSGTQIDKAHIYDSDRSAEVHHYVNCYNNDIFNMFTQEEQYTEILDPIIESHTVQQNNSNVISVESSVEHNGGTVEHHPATVEETSAYFESLYNNLEIKVEKVNTVNRKMK